MPLTFLTVQGAGPCKARPCPGALLGEGQEGWGSTVSRGSGGSRGSPGGREGALSREPGPGRVHGRSWPDRERERERESVCVYLCVCVCVYTPCVCVYCVCVCVYTPCVCVLRVCVCVYTPCVCVCTCVYPVGRPVQSLIVVLCISFHKRLLSSFPTTRVVAALEAQKQPSWAGPVPVARSCALLSFSGGSAS